jgi:hypothetical protein
MKAHDFGAMALALTIGSAAQGCASTSSPPSSDNGNSASSSGSPSSSSNGNTSSHGGSSSTTSTATSTRGSGNGSTSSSGDGGGSSSDAGTGQGGCSGLALCDDFESDTVGSPPNSALWTLVGAAGCSGSGNPNATVVYPIVVDGTQHNSGTKSVKISGGDSCGPLMVNTSAFSALSGGEVYGRFYVHMSDTTMTFDHAALMGLGLLNDGGVGLNVGDQTSYLQMASEGAGNATNVLMWQTDDSHILPNKNSAGGAESTYPSATGFTCIEFHTSNANKAIETWVNGTAVTGLTDPPVPANASQWTAPSPFSPTSLGLGWILFSGPKLDLWFDDVALSTTRINCL